MYNNIYIYIYKNNYYCYCLVKKKKKTCEDISTKETKVFKLLNFKIMISNQNCQYHTEVISLSFRKIKYFDIRS